MSRPPIPTAYQLQDDILDEWKHRHAAAVDAQIDAVAEGEDDCDVSLWSLLFWMQYDEDRDESERWVLRVEDVGIFETNEIGPLLEIDLREDPDTIKSALQALEIARTLVEACEKWEAAQ